MQENKQLRAQVKDLQKKVDEHPLRLEVQRLRADYEELEARYRVAKGQLALVELQRPQTAQVRARIRGHPPITVRKVTLALTGWLTFAVRSRWACRKRWTSVTRSTVNSQT